MGFYDYKNYRDSKYPYDQDMSKLDGLTKRIIGTSMNTYGERFIDDILDGFTYEVDTHAQINKHYHNLAARFLNNRIFQYTQNREDIMIIDCFLKYIDGEDVLKSKTKILVNYYSFWKRFDIYHKGYNMNCAELRKNDIPIPTILRDFKTSRDDGYIKLVLHPVEIEEMKSIISTYFPDKNQNTIKDFWYVFSCVDKCDVFIDRVTVYNKQLLTAFVKSEFSYKNGIPVREKFINGTHVSYELDFLKETFAFPGTPPKYPDFWTYYKTWDDYEPGKYTILEHYRA
jgi:hypothetical protein